jgi:hypothetical protein
VLLNPPCTNVFSLLLHPVPELQFLRETFLSSYAKGKKKNQFNKVQMHIEADRILQKYFSDNLATIESWFFRKRTGYRKKSANDLCYDLLGKQSRQVL